MWALVVDGQIRVATTRPAVQYDHALERWVVADDWVKVTDTTPPDIAADERLDYTIELDENGAPIRVWSVRPATPAELEQAAAEAERQAARQAVQQLRVIASADPADVTPAQVVAAVQLIARVTARLVVDRYGG